MKVQEEIKPTSHGARSEIQEPRNLRELDAEVAERVMKLPEVERVGERLQCRNDLLTRERGGTWRSVVPAYSTNREAAMQVVDHFAKADWRIMLTSNPHAPKTLRWRVELFKELWPHSNNISVMELAETLPEAICLAALSAKAAESFTQTVVE